MNNDLISREALKNEVDTWGSNDYDKYDFLEAIDNAPTVEERPQGEWITVPEYNFNDKCSLCSKFNLWKRTNFCPNCGADMRGDNE